MLFYNTLMKIWSSLIAAIMAMCLVVAPAQAQSVNSQAVPARSQMVVLTDNGGYFATPNAREPRPALSLVKLYLGMWVLRHGQQADKNRVEHMIRVSHDGIATELDRKYPNAIRSIMKSYGLTNSYYPGYWGNSTTSVVDVAKFVKAIRFDPVAAPLIRGMRNAAPIAADGYAQNYGTSRIPGVQGTKFGWSDYRDYHGTVSFGPGYVVAVSTRGPASANTTDALRGWVPPRVKKPAPRPAAKVTPASALKKRIKCHIPPTSSNAVDQLIPNNAPVTWQVVNLVPKC